MMTAHRFGDAYYSKRQSEKDHESMEDRRIRELLEKCQYGAKAATLIHSKSVRMLSGGSLRVINKK